MTFHPYLLTIIFVGCSYGNADSNVQAMKPLCPALSEHHKCSVLCHNMCDIYHVEKQCPKQCMSGCTCTSGLVWNGTKCIDPVMCGGKREVLLNNSRSSEFIPVSHLIPSPGDVSNPNLSSFRSRANVGSQTNNLQFNHRNSSLLLGQPSSSVFSYRANPILLQDTKINQPQAFNPETNNPALKNMMHRSPRNSPQQMYAMQKQFDMSQNEHPGTLDLSNHKNSELLPETNYPVENLPQKESPSLQSNGYRSHRYVDYPTQWNMPPFYQQGKYYPPYLEGQIPMQNPGMRQAGVSGSEQNTSPLRNNQRISSGDAFQPSNMEGENDNNRAKKNCPPNSVFKECAIAAECKPSCKHPKGKFPCIMICDPRCECITDYVWQGDKCINVKECPANNFMAASKGNNYDPNMEGQIPMQNPSNRQSGSSGFDPNTSPLRNNQRISANDALQRNYMEGETDNRAKKSCPPNSEFQKCAVPKECKKTCEYPDGKHTCPDMCESRCECKDGYVWQGEKCIPKKECKSDMKYMDYSEEICPPNSEFQDCAVPKECKKTCQYPDGKHTCPDMCESRCECKKGYVWQGEKCIPAEYCKKGMKNLDATKKSCPPNSIFKRCAVPKECKKTCGNPKGKQTCPAICDSRCECVEGYVWSGYKCVHLKSCYGMKSLQSSKGSCPANSKYNKCAVPSECKKTCENPKGKQTCPAMCESRCECNEGYVWKFEKCVQVKECYGGMKSLDSKKGPCPPNSAVKKCAVPVECKKTCMYPEGKFPCALVCVKRCECKDGYVWQGGKCIRKTDCYKKDYLKGSPEKCPPNAVFKECATPEGCKKTCENPKGGKKCEMICASGCDCKDGYLWNKEKKCVLPKDCKIKGYLKDPGFQVKFLSDFNELHADKLIANFYLLQNFTMKKK